VASTPAASSSSSSANVQANSITASDSATCEGEGNACVGDVTHWDGGKFNNLPPQYRLNAANVIPRPRRMWLERRHELGHGDCSSL
jgi:hypothetical protein